jgi:hypothetical protein
LTISRECLAINHNISPAILIVFILSPQQLLPKSILNPDDKYIEDEDMRMSLVTKGAMTLSILIMSSAAVAYESEREYLLDLYYGVDLEAKQRAEQAEQNTDENILTSDADTRALNLTFPIADNSTH